MTVARMQAFICSSDKPFTFVHTAPRSAVHSLGTHPPLQLLDLPGAVVRRLRARTARPDVEGPNTSLVQEGQELSEALLVPAFLIYGGGGIAGAEPHGRRNLPGLRLGSKVYQVIHVSLETAQDVLIVGARHSREV